VDDALLVGLLEGTRHLCRHLQGVLGRNALLDELLERVAVDELHDEEMDRRA
jgi:hypothetical protein